MRGADVELRVKIAIAATKSWNRRAVEDWRRKCRHEVLFIDRPEALTAAALDSFGAEIVFFPHWSWKIAPEIHKTRECILFHMTDLPYGRGGSPLQNLIVRGNASTMISAIRVVDEIDAGPVYGKRPLSLCGSAEEIFVRATGVIFEMIDDILDRRPNPVPQSGEVVTFRRRTPAQSRIEETFTLTQVYDHIRMLDAEGYPHAFAELGPLKLEFTRATLHDGRVVADVTITRNEKE
jgi:methionyl-tRNA formyltransferase